MLIILRSHADQETIDRVVEQIEKLKMQAHISQGEYRTIIGALGDETPIQPDQFLAIDGVAKVVPIMQSFKLAGRDFCPEDSIIEVSGVKVGRGHYAWIGGPCTVESRESSLDIAAAVRRCGANMMRGGAFKPRTSPYSFQGLGEEGLKILSECREKHHLPVVTEVMDPREVELVCKYADMIQIGARNMQNYSLLVEVGKANKPVLLKRGPSASVKNWLLSAEYVLSNGNKDVILCERGSQSFETDTRFTLDVGAIAVAKRDTHLPVIVDPSHAAGRWNLVEPLTLAGLAAGADGIIVEVHNCPEKARCDGPQALTEKRFSELMKHARALVNVLGKQ